jgi:hypothetical protein
LPCYAVIMTFLSLADVVPRLWSRLTAHFRSSFIDLFHECCKMGLGDLLQISTSMIAAFCAQASSEPEASASLEKLLSILRSRDFLSTHATPAVATALLHAAICFRNDSTRAVACSDAAAAVVDACCSSGAAAWPAFKDGSTVALAWCALHVFVDTETGHPSASVVCSQLWSKLQQCGVVAAQATALGAVVCPANASPIPITQRLVRLLDALPLEAQLATHADSAIPWSVRHHLSWMFTVDSELLLLQLMPLWISRSSFQPMWILQCAVQSGGDALRCSPQTANRTVLFCVHVLLFADDGPSLGWFCCISRAIVILRRFAALAARCCSLPWAPWLIPPKIAMLSIFSGLLWKVLHVVLVMVMVTMLVEDAAVILNQRLVLK